MSALQLVQGDSWSVAAQWLDALNVPVDITTFTITATIISSTDPVITLTPTVDVTDASLGKFTVSILTAEGLTLPIDSGYSWLDIFATDADSKRQTIAYRVPINVLPTP